MLFSFKPVSLPSPLSALKDVLLFFRCHRGWKGPGCNQCTIHPNCTNGYCTKPFECICHEDWAGTFCNISKKSEDTCSNDTSCGNNGECKKLQNGTKQCVCREGFTGLHCENGEWMLRHLILWCDNIYWANHMSVFCSLVGIFFSSIVNLFTFHS